MLIVASNVTTGWCGTELKDLIRSVSGTEVQLAFLNYVLIGFVLMSTKSVLLPQCSFDSTMYTVIP